MEKVSLKAAERKDTAKPARKQLRNQGRVPGVFYSRRANPIIIDVTEKDLHPLVFTSKTHLISLNIDGHDEQECIIKEVQFDPVTDAVLHFDLLGLTRGEKIELEVPVQLVGSAVGIKEGGVLQHALYKLEIECLPKDIPQHIEIDISSLAVGDAIHVEDLKLENLEILNSKDSLVVSVTHAKIQEEPVAEEEGELEETEEGAEPEVIGKGKAEESEESEEKEKKEKQS
ncbi:MAG: 50S ribosomal protein L25 [Ignavibacteria bacterium]|nr:50S ribosomal protein L25 [Ignavibacteria bacterium]MBT8380799.1 50S ribosomal protein L25 [Ignavibacteria bacterium]MBT8392750.1 50S ribosomal protein L25 [Ignavibacteria bacterium]NNJ54311.1 50S ribosomal protein L25 [Ignavibacteriaceae bacterium]NNL22055.1 50S ribosomal protein L25 [Ignavibacteriaceae bacterium]